MRKRVLLATLLILALGAGVPTAVVVIRAQSSYSAAEELLAHQLWPQARQRLASYLWLHPQDGPARLLMADALVKDESLLAADSAKLAIECLDKIPDNSPVAAEARLRQGGFYLLLLQQPTRAEQQLRKSIELGGGIPAYQLLWTLLNFSGRSEESEEVFWRVYDLSPPDEQPLRLRDWYLNQFSPLTAHEYLDRQMGILGPQETPTRSTESRRYLRFREREPDAPASHAAVAHWCQQEGDPEFAVRVLEPAAKELPTARSNSFFLAASIASYLDLGQFDKAEDSFQQWPEDDRGHTYWKWRAIILDDVRGEHEAALEAYDRALAMWPGSADWGLQYRKASCQTRLRKLDEAAATKNRIEQLKAIMTGEAQDRRLAALASLENPEALSEVAQFYRALGRNREAEGWEAYIGRLQAHLAKRQR
jgi:tetratricopeptide (TPR) repeat protein